MEFKIGDWALFIDYYGEATEVEIIGVRAEDKVNSKPMLYTVRDLRGEFKVLAHKLMEIPGGRHRHQLKKYIGFTNSYDYCETCPYTTK